jgi:hypothetical protein
MEEILRYDRRGFIPSPATTTLREYLVESRAKERLFADVREEVRRKFSRLEGELYEPPSYLKKEFYQVTATQAAWPGIKFSWRGYSAFVRSAFLKWKNLAEVALFPTLLLPRLWSAGTIVKFEKYGQKLWIPILSPSQHEWAYFHELAHVLKRQFQPYGWLSEEMTCDGIGMRVFGVELTRLGGRPLAFARSFSWMYGLNTPAVIASTFCPYLLPASLGAVLTLTLARGYAAVRKFRKFVRKCEAERLNPYYLALRSRLGEYDLGRPIREQLARAKGLRWEIMRLRMEADV